MLQAHGTGLFVPLATKTGTSGNDVLNGTTSADSLSGLAGNDTLNGDAGNDTLNGGTGSDRLVGGTGNDVYQVEGRWDVVVESSGAGTDTVVYDVAGGFYSLPANVENLTVSSDAFQEAFLIGGAGANVLTGGAGRDYIFGLQGNDTMKGMTGDDVYYIEDAGDVVKEASGAGNDWLQVDVAAYVMPANVEGAEVFRSIGGKLTGNGLNNYLGGNIGADVLAGGGGNDMLWGDAGHDTLTGGAGADAFEFSTVAGSSSDRITDFAAAEDEIWLDADIYGLPGGTLAAGGYKEIGPGGGAVDAGDRILYNGSTGQVYFDKDGSGAAAPVLLATLDNRADLNAWNFVVY